MRAERLWDQDMPAESPVTRIAARWLARRDRGLSPDEAVELAGWRAANPQHGAELDRLEAEWRGFDLAKESPELAVMLAALDQSAADARAKRKFSQARWWLPLGAAAALAVGAGLVWWRGATPAPVVSTAQPQAYRVLAGSAHRIVLDDGSVVELREGSEVRPEFSPSERRVRLVRGEAYFTVAKDAARPFFAVAGTTTVRAVGTAFNVRFDPDQTEVLVTEGRVRVFADEASIPEGTVPESLAGAGQRVLVGRVPESGGVGTVPVVQVSEASPAEVDQVLSWQSVRLVFDRTTLADAVDAFNRHSTATKGGARLILGDSRLRAKQMGGTFRASNVEGFVRLLEQSREVRVERLGSDIILRSVN